MASGLWLLAEGPGVCAQCGGLLADKALLFRWCDDMFCLKCAGGVLESCPRCGASAESATEYDEEAEPEPPPAEFSSWRWILGLLAFAAVLFALRTH